MGHSRSTAAQASPTKFRLVMLAILLATTAGFATLSAQEPGNSSDKASASDLPRLPRDNLLVYRGSNGKSAPVKSVEEWAKRRADLQAARPGESATRRAS